MRTRWAFERGQQGCRVVFLKLLQEVDTIVWVHFPEKLDRAARIDRVEHEDLTMRAQPLDDIGCGFGR
jgi:hypothetical protein